MNFDFLYPPGKAIPIRFFSFEEISRAIDRARSTSKPFTIKIGKKTHSVPLGRSCFSVFQKQPYCMECKMRGSTFILQKNDPNSSDKNQLFLRFYGISNYGSFVMMTMDHRYPKSRGGNNDMSNLQTMCSPCNRKKGNLLLGKYTY